MNRTLRNLLYLASFSFFFLMFFVWTLPYEAMKNTILHQVEEGMNASLKKNFRIQSQSMDVSLLFGVTFKNMEWIDRGPLGDVVLLKASKFRVNPSLLSLVTGSFKASYLLVLGKGEISGQIKDNQSKTEFSLEADTVSLSTVKDFLGVPLQGTWDGEMEMNLDKKDSTKNSGNFSFTFKNVFMENYSIPLDPKNPSAVLNFARIQLNGDKAQAWEGALKGNTLDLKQIKLDGPDLELDLKGKLTFSKNNAEAPNANISGKFKVSPQVSQAIPFFPLIEPQKNADGSFDLSVEGVLASKPTWPNLTVGKFQNILNQFAPSGS